MAIYTNGDAIQYNDLADFRPTTVAGGGGGGGGGRDTTAESVEVPDWALGAAIAVIVAWALGVF